MTATEVNGRKVIMDMAFKAPFVDNAGEPVYQHQTRELLLAATATDPEQVIYGCSHCVYTSWNWKSIRPHLGKCKVKKAEAAAALAKKAESAPQGGSRYEIPTVEVVVPRPAPQPKVAQRPAPARPAEVTPEFSFDALLERLARAQELEERLPVVEAQRDQWKAEALALRAQINTLRSFTLGKKIRSNAKVL